MAPPAIWSEFDSAAGRVDDDMQFREVDIFNVESVYNHDTGKYENSRVLSATVRCELTEPNQPKTITDASGTESQVDARVFVPEDVAVEISGAGGSQEATVFRERLRGKQYEAREVTDENNGQTRVETVESDHELPDVAAGTGDNYAVDYGSGGGA